MVTTYHRSKEQFAQVNMDRCLATVGEWLHSIFYLIIKEHYALTTTTNSFPRDVRATFLLDTCSKNYHTSQRGKEPNKEKEKQTICGKAFKLPA